MMVELSFYDDKTYYIENTITFPRNDFTSCQLVEEIDDVGVFEEPIYVMMHCMTMGSSSKNCCKIIKIDDGKDVAAKTIVNQGILEGPELFR